MLCTPNAARPNVQSGAARGQADGCRATVSPVPANRADPAIPAFALVRAGSAIRCTQPSRVTTRPRGVNRRRDRDAGGDDEARAGRRSGQSLGASLLVASMIGQMTGCASATRLV